MACPPLELVPPSLHCMEGAPQQFNGRGGGRAHRRDLREGVATLDENGSACVCACDGSCGRRTCGAPCEIPRSSGEGYCKECARGLEVTRQYHADALPSTVSFVLAHPLVLHLSARSLPAQCFELCRRGELRCPGCFDRVQGLNKTPHDLSSTCLGHGRGEDCNRLRELLVALRSRLAAQAGTDVSSKRPSKRVKHAGGDGIAFPYPSELVDDLFEPQKVDIVADRTEREIPSTDDFLPKDSPRFRVCEVSRFLNLAEWFSCDTFHNRIKSMVTFFNIRDVLVAPSLCQHEREVLVNDACMYWRVAQRQRKDAKCTAWAYQHYRRNYREECDARVFLAELLLNACLLRNTLSEMFRWCLREEKVPWLKLEVGSGTISNLDELDALFLMCEGDLFGTHANPMRTRREQSEGGYWDLIIDCEETWYRTPGPIIRRGSRVSC